MNTIANEYDCECGTYRVEILYNNALSGKLLIYIVNYY